MLVGIAEGGIHAFVGQDARHAMHLLGGVGLALQDGETGGEVINASEAGLMRGLGGIAQALAVGHRGDVGSG